MENNSSIFLVLKRTIAALIDMTLLVIATLFIFFIAVEPIANKITDLPRLTEEYHSKYEEYNVKIWNEALGGYETNEDATEDQIKAFNNDPKVIELNKQIATIEYGETIISLSLSITLIYILLPLISRRGCTLGKKAIGLVVETRKDTELTKTQILIRELSFVIIELIGGILTYGIIPLLSLALVSFNKNKLSLHDYFSKTTVNIMTKKPKEKIINEEDDEYYQQIAEDEFRDLRVGGKRK